MKELRASVDIGSNSCLLLIGEVLDGKVERILESKSFVTGLGRDLDKKKEFSKIAMQETYQALLEYSQITKKYNIDSQKIIVTATEASRVAQNAKQFFTQIENEIGIHINIITAEAEAYFSATGVLCDKNELSNPLYILDIGGASTELIKLNTEEKKIIESFSMPVGSVRYSSWIPEGIQEKKMEEIYNNFSKKIASSRTKLLCCVAGTMTSIANMYLENPNFEEDEVHGLNLKVTEIFRMKEEFKNYTAQMFLQKFPFLGKRAATIYAGINIICSIVDKLNVEMIYISTYGLRYGTLVAGRIEDEFIA